MPQEYKHSMPSPNFTFTGLLLYILPSPLILKLVFSLLTVNLFKLLLTAGALFFFYSAAHMTRTSLLALKNAPSHKKNKTKDYRLLSAIYVVVGVLFLMFLIRARLPMVILMSGSALLGYYLLYGFPEKQQKTVSEAEYEKMPKATRQAIQAAFQDLDNIEALSEALDPQTDAAILEKIRQVLKQSYIIMRLLVKKPEDASRARRFLNVYIHRIKVILEQYIKLAQHKKADLLRPKLLNTLTEVEKAFREKREKLLDNDISQLDIQLEVLDEQINNEN